MIIGGVGETDRDWERSLHDVMGLASAPPHISAYSLTVEPGTPLATQRTDTPTRMCRPAGPRWPTRSSPAAGYRWEEISNLSLPGHACRHNRLYWDQGEYWGIGSAAHSHRDGRRWWNVRTPDRFVKEIGAGRSATAGEELLTSEQRRFEALALGLRTRDGCPPTRCPMIRASRAWSTGSTAGRC